MIRSLARFDQAEALHEMTPNIGGANSLTVCLTYCIARGWKGDSAKVTFLSRRKPGFDSPWGHQFSST